MCSVTHMADVQKMIQLIPNFVLSAPSNKSYGSCDWLPHFGKDHYSDRIKASPFIHIYSPIGRTCKELSPAISVAICTTQHHWLCYD